MRETKPFLAEDLAELEECFYAKATRVVALEDVLDGERTPNVIGLRHDCDDRLSLATAVRMAHWEHERGYRSTYFLLHSSPYWRSPRFEAMVAEIADLGHEIGLHNNALATSFRTGRDPFLILEDALTRLRSLGYPVRGTAGHGDRLCNYYAGEGEPWFANDELFLECRREKIEGVEVPANRMLWRGSASRRLEPRPMAEFGLEYEGLWLGLPFYHRFSDSGGRWSAPGWQEMTASFAETVQVTRAPMAEGDPRQLHMLIHPDWWADAFSPVRQAA